MIKQLLVAMALLLLTPFIASADEIRLQSSKSQSVDLNVITSAATTVTVDWGDGNPVAANVTTTDINGSTTTISGVPQGTVIVKGDGITLFDCSYAGVVSINVSNASGLLKLSVNNNQLTALDLSSNTALYSLHTESNPSLSSMDLTNNRLLELLYCNDDAFTSLDVSQNTRLTTLNVNNNKISSINLSANKALKSLYAINNLFQTIDLSQNTNLTYISMIGNKLTSMDVTALTALKSLFISNNNITQLTGALNVAKAATLNCSGNKLNFATLPQPENVRTNFTYAPQQNYVLPASVKVGETIDLSSLNGVRGVLTSAATTSFSWANTKGVALVSGVDYEETNGVFKFLTEQPAKIVCTLTSAAFPKFTGTSAYKTTEMLVTNENITELRNSGSDKARVAFLPATNSLHVEAENTVNQIEMYTASGRMVFSATNQPSTFDIPVANLSDGVYLLRVQAEKSTYSCKCIIRR